MLVYVCVHMQCTNVQLHTHTYTHNAHTFILLYSCMHMYVFSCLFFLSFTLFLLICLYSNITYIIRNIYLYILVSNPQIALIQNSFVVWSGSGLVTVRETCLIVLYSQDRMLRGADIFEKRESSDSLERQDRLLRSPDPAVN